MGKVISARLHDQLVRMVAIKLLRDQIPHAPAAAAITAPWREQAEEIVDLVLPYIMKEVSTESSVDL